ncbi:hypothetical protein VNO78_04235 [Psophocarpus tetragonolobus]|uniref:Uncharacterized protein n=1 Tax=Psophocarpus tetragonolobus TaxID=3891 RepID=A0AAN9T298_PSOTE
MSAFKLFPTPKEKYRKHIDAAAKTVPCRNCFSKASEKVVTAGIVENMQTIGHWPRESHAANAIMTAPIAYAPKEPTHTFHIIIITSSSIN